MPWPLTTLLWSGIAFAVPMNYALPGAARLLWLFAIMVTISVSVLFLRLARPIYPAVWVLAGYASIVATLTATKATAMTDNLFVGAQLVVLLGFGPFVLAFNASSDPRFAQRVGVAFLVGQTLSASVAVSQLLGLSIKVPGAVFGVAFGRAAGLTEHPNTLGLMACIAILLALQILRLGHRHRLVTLAVIAINLLGLFASGSLTALLALVIGFVVAALCMRDYLGRMAITSAIFAAALGLIVSVSGILDYLPSLSERYAQVVSRSENTSSWEARKQTYEFAWNKISEDAVFGNGLSTGSSGTFDGVITVHNMVLRSWYQGGIFLGMAFALVILAALALTVRAIITKQYGCEVSIIVAILVYGALSPLFEQRHFWIPILIAWASISAKVNAQKRPAGDAAQFDFLTAATRSHPVL